MTSYGHLCDIDEDIISQLLSLSSDWTLFKSRGNNNRFIDIIPMEYLLFGILPEKYKFLNTIYSKIIEKISSNGDKIIPLEMLMCYYPDGSFSTGMHKHNCRSITLSIGFDREFQINTKKIILKNGDYVILYKQSHGVPKSSEQSGPRISLNLFYYHEGDQNVSIKG